MVFGFFSRAQPQPSPNEPSTSAHQLRTPSPSDSPAPHPPPSPSPEPQVQPHELHALLTTIPPKTLHSYTLTRLHPDFPTPPTPATLTVLGAFFAHLTPPPLLHCVRCHKDYYDVENDDRKCLVPHDDDSAEVARLSNGEGYETLWECCGKTVEGDGDRGPPDGWCYEGKHTTDIKRARFRADSTLHDDKLVSCLRRNCHGQRDALRAKREQEQQEQQQQQHLDQQQKLPRRRSLASRKRARQDGEDEEDSAHVASDREGEARSASVSASAGSGKGRAARSQGAAAKPTTKSGGASAATKVKQKSKAKVEPRQPPKAAPEDATPDNDDDTRMQVDQGENDIRTSGRATKVEPKPAVRAPKSKKATTTSATTTATEKEKPKPSSIRAAKPLSTKPSAANLFDGVILNNGETGKAVPKKRKVA